MAMTLNICYLLKQNLPSSPYLLRQNLPAHNTSNFWKSPTGSLPSAYNPDGSSRYHMVFHPFLLQLQLAKSLASLKITEALPKLFGSHQSHESSELHRNTGSDVEWRRMSPPNSVPHLLTWAPHSSVCIQNLPKSPIEGFQPMLRISLSLSVSFWSSLLKWERFKFNMRGE